MAIPCKIRILRELNGVFPKYQPAVGKVYDGVYVPPNPHPSFRGINYSREFCVLDIADKKIIVRPGEYEMIGGGGNA